MPGLKVNAFLLEFIALQFLLHFNCVITIVFTHHFSVMPSSVSSDRFEELNIWIHKVNMCMSIYIVRLAIPFTRGGRVWPPVPYGERFCCFAAEFLIYSSKSYAQKMT